MGIAHRSRSGAGGVALSDYSDNAATKFRIPAVIFDGQGRTGVTVLMDLELICIECGREFLADVKPDHGMCPACAKEDEARAEAKLAGDCERDEK
jgi:hypothetical protein